MERVKGIEPSSQAWEAHILPLNHTRFAAESDLTNSMPLINSHFIPRGDTCEILSFLEQGTSLRSHGRERMVPPGARS